MTHRRWGETRKILEQDLLCDTLKGRVRYFATRYRKAHDDVGRVCVLVDGQEIINMPFFTETQRYAETHKRREHSLNKSFQDVFAEVYDDFANEGKYYAGDFGFALDEFLSLDIQEALKSDNWLVRMMAIMDRRVGKRTLEKIKPSIHDLPDWLQYFYNLRIESVDSRR